MWVVRILVSPRVNDFRHGFFPRTVRLKRDALELKREVEGKGGKAEVVKK